QILHQGYHVTPPTAVPNSQLSVFLLFSASSVLSVVNSFFFFALSFNCRLLTSSPSTPSRRHPILAHHPSIFELYQPIPVSRIPLRMRNLNNRSPRLIEPPKQLHNLLALFRVQIPGGLIRQNQFRILN